VHKELRVALNAADERPPGAIFLIPARLDECEVPERLQHLQRVDLFRPDGRDQLFRALEREASRLPVGAAIERDEAVGSESQIESARQIHDFVKKARLTDVIRILVISHTGGVTLRALLDALGQSGGLTGVTKPLALHVLLRSKQLSDLSRAQSIERSVQRLASFAVSTKMISVEARYYASPLCYGV
jgi:hypothetical protein